MRSHIGVVLSLTILLACGLHAASGAAIVNPGFEINDATPIAGWTVAGGFPASGEFNPDLGGGTTAIGSGWSGSQVGLIYSDGGQFGSDVTGTVSQTLTGTPVAANTNYVLNVNFGHRDDVGPSAYPNVLSLPGEFGIRLRVGGTELSGGVITAATVPYRGFGAYSVSYTTGDSVPVGDLEIQIFIHRLTTDTTTVPPGYNPQNHGNFHEEFLAFDDVSLMATSVPEPTSAAVLMLCASAIAARSMRARASRTIASAVPAR